MAVEDCDKCTSLKASIRQHAAVIKELLAVAVHHHRDKATVNLHCGHASCPVCETARAAIAAVKRAREILGDD